ncbi:MAG TPA: ATP-binding protein [Acidimicrobiia bacterium]|nr:ATP-binding protein [Acidimicrobiia bacterium]
MRRRLLISYLSITLFVLVALALPLGLSFSQAEERRLTSRVQDDAYALALRVGTPLEQGDTVTLDRLVRQLAGRAHAAIVVVDSAGQVRASTGPGVPRSGPMAVGVADLDAGRGGRQVTGRRVSPAGDVLAVTVPVLAGDGRVGALRVGAPVAMADDAVRNNWLLLGGLAGLIALIVGLVSTLLARSFTRPVAALDASAARLGAGDLSARVAVPDDPPELRRLAQSFNATAQRLESLLTSQRGFVADASHQLRTPLAALRLRLENIEADGPSHHPDDLDGALAEVARLTELVESLLILARAEDAPTPTVDVALRPLVEARLDAWMAVADGRGVGLDADVVDVGVRSETGRVEQVLDNLISNALDAAPAGSVVHVGVSPAGEQVSITVRDHGPGMTLEEQARAFDRFWRSPDARHSRSGFGLGLPIVQRLVVADGGYVRLGHAPDGGLEVAVSLPAARRLASRRVGV